MHGVRLVHRLALRLLVADLEMLRALDGLQPDCFASGASQSQGNLLGGLRLRRLKSKAQATRRVIRKHKR